MYLFLIIILWILFVGHFFIYSSLMTIYWLYKYKIVMRIILAVLTLSFVFASYMVHNYDSFLSKKLYYFVSIWHWLMSFLFFWFLILFLVYNLFQAFWVSLNLKTLWYIVIFCSIFITSYWIYNANNIVINKVDVSLKNIPEKWKSKKVVFLSDIHIWAINSWKFMDKISDKINSLNPDIVFISGDLFDWSDWELNDIHENIDKINAKDWVYYVNWNHEVYLWMDLTNSILEKTKIKILEDEIVNLDWVQIVWVSYLDDRTGLWNISEKLKTIKWFDKNTASILLYHSPVFVNDFAKFGINLQLSWHTHKWQFWPYWYITSMIYKWNDYWLNTYGDYNIYTSNWVGTWWPPLRVWNNPEIVILNFK